MKTQCVELVTVSRQLSCASPRATCRERKWDVRGVRKQSSSMDFFPLTRVWLWVEQWAGLISSRHSSPPLKKRTCIFAFFVNQKALVFSLAQARPL